MAAEGGPHSWADVSLLETHRKIFRRLQQHHQCCWLDYTLSWKFSTSTTFVVVVLLIDTLSLSLIVSFSVWLKGPVRLFVLIFLLCFSLTSHLAIFRNNTFPVTPSYTLSSSSPSVVLLLPRVITLSTSALFLRVSRQYTPSTGMAVVVVEEELRRQHRHRTDRCKPVAVAVAEEELHRQPHPRRDHCRPVAAAGAERADRKGHWAVVLVLAQASERAARTG